MRVQTETTALKLNGTQGRLILAIALFCCSSGYAQIAQPNLTGAGTLNPNGNNPVTQARPAHGDINGGPVEVPEDFSTLKLAPGFLLDVQVFDEPELSGTVRVSEHGDINLPLIGSIHVAGETLPQVEAGLVSKFREMKILLQPQVTLNIEQYAGSKITVLGEVQNPGRVDLLTSRSLDDVLSRVGGETITAGNVIQIKRIADGVQHTETIHYVRSEGTDKLRDVMIQPGDTVIVPRAGIVYVLGAVGKPGGYVMQEDGKLDVIQAISLADGTNINAAIGSVRIVRKGPNESLQEIHVPFRDITKGKAAPIQLESEDIVYVPVSKLKTALAASLVTSASSAAIYTR